MSLIFVSPFAKALVLASEFVRGPSNEVVEPAKLNQTIAEIAEEDADREWEDDREWDLSAENKGLDWPLDLVEHARQGYLASAGAFVAAGVSAVTNAMSPQQPSDIDSEEWEWTHVERVCKPRVSQE